MKITISAHAVQRATERGITEEEIIQAIMKPEGRKQQHRSKRTGGFVYLFTKTIGEGRKLHVAADLYKDECIVVSTYWE
jgi:hypothetical protein